jgi:hypothetical protein
MTKHCPCASEELFGLFDIQVRPDYGREAAALIPGARFHLFRGPRASHCSCLEMQDEFLRETFGFVDAIPH